MADARGAGAGSAGGRAAGGASSKFNRNHGTIRRIHQEMKELAADPSPDYVAAPLDDDLFEWHFTMRGPPDTEFEGGVYHGRILLPTEYPLKPPNIMFLTPNGRFQTKVKICLSISAYHPESWLPAWGVRLILEALTSFMPSAPEGAVGSLNYTPAERRTLAARSRHFKCPVCGPTCGLLPEVSAESNAARHASAKKYAEQIAQLKVVAPAVAAAPAAAAPAAAAPAAAAPAAAAPAGAKGPAATKSGANAKAAATAGIVGSGRATSAAGAAAGAPSASAAATATPLVASAGGTRDATSPSTSGTGSAGDGTGSAGDGSSGSVGDGSSGGPAATGRAQGVAGAASASGDTRPVVRRRTAAGAGASATAAAAAAQPAAGAPSAPSAAAASAVPATVDAPAGDTALLLVAVVLFALIVWLLARKLGVRGAGGA